MAYNHEYPYVDPNRYNSDWELNQVIALRNEMETFEALNKITFSGEWDITKQYPAWTIVNDNNGRDGYISIQPVPAGVTIDNTDYWRSVANYSDLIANLQNRVVALEGDVEDLQEEAASHELRMEDRVFLLMGDSYDDRTGFLTLVGDEIGCADYIVKSETGAGFYKYNSGMDELTYYYILTTLDPLTDAEKAVITDVAFCIAVGNDNPQVNADLENALDQMDAYLKANLPKLQHIHLYPVGWASNLQSLQDRINLNLAIYAHKCPSIGWKYVDCTRIMRSAAFAGTDDVKGYHPTQAGGNYIAQCVANAIVTGSCSWERAWPVLEYTYTPSYSGTMSGATMTYPDGGKVAMIGRIKANGDIAIHLKSWSYLFTGISIPAGTSYGDIILTADDGVSYPFPIEANSGYAVSANKSFVAAAQIINRSDGQFRIRVFFNSDSALSNQSFEIMGQAYIIQ